MNRDKVVLRLIYVSDVFILWLVFEINSFWKKKRCINKLIFYYKCVLIDMEVMKVYVNFIYLVFL